MSDDYAARRRRMVESDLVTRGIRNEGILSAFRRVPREEFIPPGYLSLAYSDRPIPIDCGQTTSQPYMIARMLELANLSADSAVLEVGTGSGYQTALLAELVDHVYSVERIAELAVRARAVLGALGYDNVNILVTDGSAGWAEHAPYDAIIVSAAAPGLPEPLLEQLAEGGRLVIPVGPRFDQMLTVVHRRGASLERRLFDPCTFVPLIGQFAHGI